MKIGIMQPYFFPYIGYFKLINQCEKFVLYDNIQYSKKGWINRNNILVNHQAKLFSLPIAKDSDYLDIKDRKIANSFSSENFLNQIKGAYAKAPHFDVVYDLLKKCTEFENRNLFNFIYHSIEQVCNFLEIKTDLLISSEVKIDHSLKFDQKIIAICKSLGYKEYLNPIGGVELYSKKQFPEEGINIDYLENIEKPYQQLGKEFIGSLSIIDVMMIKSREDIKISLNHDYLIF